MLTKMQNSEEGREILKLRPRINSNTVDLKKLKQFPEGTLGKAYSNFLETNVSFSRLHQIYCLWIDNVFCSKLLQIQE